MTLLAPAIIAAISDSFPPPSIPPFSLLPSTPANASALLVAHFESGTYLTATGMRLATSMRLTTGMMRCCCLGTGDPMLPVPSMATPRRGL